MDFTYNPFTKETRVKLSRSNLKALLSLLDRPHSERTLTRITEDDWLLSVTAEEDDEHYGSRQRGIMDAETEAAING